MAFHADQPFAFTHAVYFALADRTESNMRAFAQACVDFLSNHPGQVYFALGTRALEMRREVNVVDFDVSMLMVFDTFASYQQYRINPRHEDFITVTAGMAIARRVFDSYTTHEIGALPAPSRATGQE